LLDYLNYLNYLDYICLPYLFFSIEKMQDSNPGEQVRSLVHNTSLALEKSRNDAEKKRKKDDQIYFDGFMRSGGLQAIEHELTNMQKQLSRGWESKKDYIDYNHPNPHRGNPHNGKSRILTTFRHHLQSPAISPDDHGRNCVAMEDKKGEKYFDHLTSYNRCRIVEQNLNQMLTGNQVSSYGIENYFKCYHVDGGDYKVYNDAHLMFNHQPRP
jgi:hypothetical protein